MKGMTVLLVVGLASIIAFPGMARAQQLLVASAASVETQSVTERYGRLPLSFEANHGQANHQVKFLSRGSGYRLFLTSTEAVMALETATTPGTAVVTMRLIGAKPGRITGVDALPGTANYFIGNDPAKWRTHVPTYAKVRYQNVYRGIDVVYYGNQRQLEYDFVVAPGADPRSITLSFLGVDRLAVDGNGDLVLHTAGGRVRQRKPVIYQEVDGVRKPITGGYARRGRYHVGFRVAAYDAHRPLVIDPVLVYSSYLGGSAGDVGMGIAVDAQGNAYVTGGTTSADFPTTAGAFDTSFGPGLVFTRQAFVTKLDPTGSLLLYSTFLGGSGGNNRANAIAVDAAGQAYVTGWAESTDFPTTAGAFDRSHNGGPLGFATDVFVTKLDATGSTLVYSTFLGGSGIDFAGAIAIDSAGNAYVTGSTASADFPTTPGAFNTTFSTPSEPFVTKLNASGSGLVYSTFLGGAKGTSPFAIAVDTAGNAYVTGNTNDPQYPVTAGAFKASFGPSPVDSTGRAIYADGFVTKLNAAGSALVYSTFLGGGGSDGGVAIVVDQAGNAYVGGSTSSADFPTTAGAFDRAFHGVSRLDFDAFVTKLDPTGSTLVYSTYLGGSGLDSIVAIATDAAGNAYVVGGTGSPDFPTTAGAQSTALSGALDGFVTALDATGSTLLYSTYLGGTGSGDAVNAIALDTAGNIYVTGSTDSVDFPTTAGAFDPSFNDHPINSGGDAFVAKFSALAPPQGADISVTMTAAPNLLPVGASLTYTITVANAGPSAATAVTLTDTLPAGLTLASPLISSQGTCGASGQAISCALGTLASGASATVTIAATPTVAGAVTNTATVSSGVSDPVSANNVASVAVTILRPGQADLRVTMVATPSVVGANPRTGPGMKPAPSIAPITYSIDVENLGPEPASGVVLTDTLPRGVGPIFPLPKGCGPSGAGIVTISCDLGSLGPAQKKTITLAATPTRVGTVTNTATVTMASGPGAPSDPDPSNNQASTTVTVVQAPADLRVRMVATPSVVSLNTNPGHGRPGEILYTIDVENLGPGAFVVGNKKAVLTDVLPAGVALVSQPKDLFAQRCGVSGGTISCDIVSLAPGEVRTISIRVGATAVGTVTNTATLTLPSAPDAPPDPDPSNNSASATVTVADRSQADLRVQVTATPTQVVLGAARGGEITYTIAVENQGPGGADRVVLTDVLPAGVTLASPPRGSGKQSASCQVTGSTISCLLGLLHPGDRSLVTFSVVPTASGTVTNTATATTTGPGALPDPDASNNSASATVTVADRDQADLRVQMVAAPAVVTPGTQVTYTIDIDNLGPAHIPSVRLVDVLPAGVTVVSISAPPVDHRPCTVNGNTISCGLGSFGAGPANPNSKRVTIVVTASASGTVTSTVTATAMRANTPPVGDPDPSNNSASATVTVVDLGGATANLTAP